MDAPANLKQSQRTAAVIYEAWEEWVKQRT
jgi:hypothetical protein